ncbi:MAG: 50S ribosomal protein L33 [Candidatus Phytoplasma australasiaticum]|nr:50S ribosomal protein L33 [Candidatus Phytoplasma australasiaticum]MDV3153642.1 50S ribosomal protein L33 [Candidatus Phytoplasma australasiaticum]MDV3167466.1 50S ribosomal protein L33 [Candidatus Phytoplasma australasiaticum]MDV3180866.1 50S ribosomal protein L33 [Candidatus Phytoplasma australasiaticum]MDV3183212.1 50S ribosomal protein L33 [Candidatus Phytoplasma australasiaticum]
MSELVKLFCQKCGRENYHTYKNKKQNPKNLELNKYCPFERKYLLHKEKK